MDAEKDKMIQGERYFSNDKTLLAERQKTKKLLHRLNVTEYVANGNSRAIIRDLLPNASRRIYIEPPFHCDYGENIHLGDNVYFNTNCLILDSAPVHIGNNVLIGPGVHIYTASHPLEQDLRRQYSIAKPVTIESDCWIGGNSVICPGVTIGQGTVVGAGSVVTKSLPSFVMAAGNPARIIKHLEPSESEMK